MGIPSTSRAPIAGPLVVFALVTAGLLYFHGNRFVVTLDEGIPLETAQRMLNGQRLYADFFGYMSPGSYWLQELMFRLFGLTFLAGRILPIVWCALQASLVYRLTYQFTTRTAACLATGFYVAIQLEDHSNITAKHRWDSAALALLSVSLAVDARLHGGWIRWTLIGVFGCAAALCTPSIGFVLLATLCWLLFEKQFREAGLVIGGAVACGAPALAWLVAHGEFSAFLDQLRWLSNSHSGVNTMSYGSIMGGYGKILANGEGVGKLVPLGLAICLALPAILPLLGITGLISEAYRGKTKFGERQIFVYMAVAIIAFIAATAPRLCVSMLLYTTALPVVASAIRISRSWPRKSTPFVLGLFAVFLGAFAMNFGAESAKGLRVDTVVGTVKAAPEDSPALTALLKAIKPGESLYVHPYMPLLYFVTQAKNPARFNFLHPGMMSETDEGLVLIDLTNAPPRWLMYSVWSRADFIRLFPGGSAKSEHFPRIENWVESHYDAVEPKVALGGYQLLRRRDSPSAVTASLPGHPASQ